MKNEMQIYLAVVLCGLGDAITTLVRSVVPDRIVGYAYSTIMVNGVPQLLGQPIVQSLGEQNPFFIPLLSTLIFVGVFFLLDRLRVPEDLRELTKAGLVLVALSPVLNNIAILLKIPVFFSGVY